MLVPHARSRTVRRPRSISTARPSFESSRISSVDSIDGSRLRGIPVELALKISRFDFAAGQRHRLENPLIPECRVLIALFRRAAALDWVLIALVVFLVHRECTCDGESLTCNNHAPQLLSRYYNKAAGELVYILGTRCTRGWPNKRPLRCRSLLPADERNEFLSACLSPRRWTGGWFPISLLQARPWL